MLLLKVKYGVPVYLGNGITVTPLRQVGDRVRLGIDAPPDVLVLRGELRRCNDCGETLIDCRCSQADARGTG